MKFITSFWGIAVIGLIMNLMVVGFVSMRLIGKFAVFNHYFEPQVEEIVEVKPDHNDRYWTFRSTEIEELARNLLAQRAEISAKKSEMMLLRERIHAEKGELEFMKKELYAYEGRFDEAFKKIENEKKVLEEKKKEMSLQYIEVEQSEQKNLKALATAYTNLTPSAAVGVFKEMEDILAVKILSQMKPDVIAAIFEEMAKTPDATNAKDPTKTMSKRVATLSDKLRLLTNAPNKSK